MLVVKSRRIEEKRERREKEKREEEELIGQNGARKEGRKKEVRARVKLMLLCSIAHRDSVYIFYFFTLLFVTCPLFFQVDA